MSGDPADVGGAPENVVLLEVEHPACSQLGIEQIPRAGVLDALGFAGRTGGIEQIQGMLRIHPFGLACRSLPGDDVVPPSVAAALHGAVAARAAVDDDVPYTRAALGERLVDR